jgi:dihydroneopterin aldolase
MDRILVPELPLQARVGVGEEERAAPQTILVEIELHLDLARAGRTDDLAESVDYEAVCEVADAVARSRPFRLIEAIAEETAASVLERFAVVEVRVRVKKPGALVGWRAPFAAVEVWRRRNG